MALKDLTLESLAETQLQGMFSEALSTVETSLEKDSDIKGARTINIALTFTPTERAGIIHADMQVKTSTPSRKVMSIAALENRVLKIDTISNDAQQPDIFDGKNIIEMKKAQVSGG